MLHSDVKQRINTCRDILVGKLPDPKSQVIQITNALIYKFMDDQDRLAEKLGGKASFFTGALKPFAWHKLFDSKLTNQERADLYIEGIQKLAQANNLPSLFRDIFKEAYVPFRAAQTITLFINEINKFDYNNSEELGNAYEYLLSIMGSQGDAGQFRTPRHIIDFMVDVIDPRKGETIYDPACGTAGFLISAYKHILNSNGGKLTANERRVLGENITGVDISPDMAKMARVNLYLHGFGSPSIREGDTLSDEDLWGTKYDVILANPPFMSPKGGIIPHDKFSIKAKRAEVLFTDFIAEHLKLKGRAAIVVPEGIIFQAGTSYRELRKMLVEDGYLYMVISLPTGVFQPYSGVKTTILVLDRERAKEATEVLFLKIENDGYTLNTQRSKCDDGQLAEALVVAKAWRKGEKVEVPFASWVEKSEIGESGDFNLSAEKYRVFETVNSAYPHVKLGDLLDFHFGDRITKKEHTGEKYPVYGGGGESFRTDEYNRENQYIISRFAMSPECVRFVQGKFWLLDSGGTFSVSEKYKNHAVEEYVGRILLSIQDKIYACARGGAQKNLDTNQLKSLKIPLPPIEIQRGIVNELNHYQNIIDGAQKVVENYVPLVSYSSEWQRLKLGDVCDFEGGTQPPKSTFLSKPEEGYVRLLQIRDYKSDKNIVYIPVAKRHKTCVETDVMIGRYGPPVFQILRGKAGAYNVALMKCVPDRDRLSNDWLYYFLLSDPVQQKIISLSERVRQSGVRPSDLRDLLIPLPSLEEQENEIKKIKHIENFIENNKSLVEIFEKKIQEKITEVWGE